MSRADFRYYAGPGNRDYGQAYDLLDSSSLFPGKDRDYLLMRQLGRIHQNFPHEEFLIYYRKFTNQTKDTVLLNAVKQEYALELVAERNVRGSMILRDLSGEMISLDDLLRKHKGKLMYLDFWASWCGPCRAAMPASALLREKLSGEEIVFVYLSLDQKVNLWAIASGKERLNRYEESYLVLNADKADFIQLNKVGSIPRYMIIDREGKIVYSNAPRVESSEIERILRKAAEKDL